MEKAMKRAFAVFMALILMIPGLTACGRSAVSDASADGRIKIVATIFPEYDWVMNILGDKSEIADVTLLLDNGVDLHSYQPTADDILRISTCDLFIYVGGESDEWVEDALKEATNKDMSVVNLMEALGDRIREEELIEGMEAWDDADGETGEPEYDEHIWLSLRNASYLVNTISEAIQSIDPANADVYRANTQTYTDKIDALEAEYSAAVSEAGRDTLLFADRFPFRYMTEDYGLSYYAAFAGCSAETEASFRTVTFLAQKTDELALHSVLTIEGTDHKIAETIIQNTESKDQQILSLDSMQSTTLADALAGSTYLSIMERNLEVLKQALYD